MNNTAILKKDLNSTFMRNERKGSFLVIQNGLSINEAVIINKIGNEILEYINDKRSINDIIKILAKNYSDVPFLRIKSDVEQFTKKMIGLGLVKFEEDDQLYSGKIIEEINEYTIYRCTEGDIKLINSILKSPEIFSELENPLIDKNNYNLLSIRARLFNFLEEFYILKKDEQNMAILSFNNSQNTINKASLIGKFIILKEVENSVICDFVKNAIEDFKNNIDVESVKIRFTTVSDSEDVDNYAANIMKTINFEKTAVFFDEFGRRKNHIFFDYNFA